LQRPRLADRLPFRRKRWAFLQPDRTQPCLDQRRASRASIRSVRNDRSVAVLHGAWAPREGPVGAPNSPIAHRTRGRTRTCHAWVRLHKRGTKPTRGAHEVSPAEGILAGRASATTMAPAVPRRHLARCVTRSRHTATVGVDKRRAQVASIQRRLYDLAHSKAPSLSTLRATRAPLLPLANFAWPGTRLGVARLRLRQRRAWQAAVRRVDPNSSLSHLPTSTTRSRALIPVIPWQHLAIDCARRCIASDVLAQSLA
jgi:hypothetical protein